MTLLKQTVIPYGAPEKVMRLARLGSMHQCRLSFIRILTRRMAQENWQFSRAKFDLDAKGVGCAVYCAKGPKRTYSLIAFGHDIPAEKRSDRVIATTWDATFTLFDGVPTADDIQRLAQNVPMQETGRVNEKSLSLSRANRSVRLWEHCLNALANGVQPDKSQIDAVGYLMRTTAVYGSGKFGAADYDSIAARPEMRVPFQAEMLSVYLIRTFVRDLINHMARARGGNKAVKMAPQIARSLGIGNSTGLGLAPFIINHPLLFNNWMMVRQEAIARVCACAAAPKHKVAQFRKTLVQAAALVANWKSEHPVQVKKLAQLTHDINLINEHLAGADITQNYPWKRLLAWAETALSLEGQEWLTALILEPYGDLIDDLAPNMANTASDAFRIDGKMPVSKVRNLIQKTYGWALGLDWTASKNTARAWYVSEEKLEPRVGERFEEHIEPYEQPLAPARDAASAHALMANWEGDTPIAAFLLRHTEHRHTVRRAQIAQHAPYSEIQDNTISAKMFPVDLLRAKLAFFGATHFDPRSDRWLRIAMYKNAPYPEELTPQNADFWIYPRIDG